MVRNLQEGFLYARLPEGLLSLDESGVINALLGGYQDRLDDLRAYAEKLTLLMGPNFPETGDNCVLADLLTSKGNTITRSLEFEEDTPPDGTDALTQWAADQLGLTTEYVTNVRYGVDPLRQVSADTLEFLAESLGAVLYPTLATTDDEKRADQERILATYFPRLRIKGTAQSFVVLARLLGYDDVIFTPLWQRVSPRLPNDVGNPVNDADFNATPEYYPQQETSLLYDPHTQDDGAFYSWVGTVASGTSENNYYPLINDFNPYFKVTVLSAGEEVQAPPDGTYLLSGGGPHTKATVTPANSGVRFDAISEGDSFNNLPIQVTTLSITDSGTLQALQVDWRLSAVKYRSSYFDLAVVMDFDRAEQIFCTTAVGRNKDLVNDPASANFGSIALSPYRPWTAGSIDTGLVYRDFLVLNGTQSIVVDPRSQVTSDGTNRQLDMDAYFKQGAQAVRTFEEIRPATRFIRRAGVGFGIDDEAQFAPYVSVGTLFITGTGSIGGTYAGWAWDLPIESTAYVAINGTTLVAEADPLNGSIWYYGVPGFTGTFNFANGSYLFVADPDVAGTLVTALWELTTTGTIRPEPTWQQKYNDEVTYQVRPEDEANGNLYEAMDEYPWRREPIINGELVDTDFVRTVDEDYVDVIGARIALSDQTGAGYDLYGASSVSGQVRLIPVVKDTIPYSPGQVPVGIRGQTKNLALIPEGEMTGEISATELETYYEDGAEMFHVGLVQNVLVADPVRFFGTHHTESLWAWLPVNEHVDDALTVYDRANNLSSVTVAGVQSVDRLFDSGTFGWHLRMRAGAQWAWTRPEVPPETISLSFWLNALDNLASVGEDEIFRYGPLSITLEQQSATMRIYAEDPDGVDQLVGTMYPNYNEWYQFSIVWRPLQIIYGFAQLGDSTIPLSLLDIISRPLTEDETGFTFKTGTRPYAMRDVRVWTEPKLERDFLKVNYHDPVPTPVCYPVPSFAILTSGDLYTLKVLPSGFVVPSPDPVNFRGNRLVWVRRYDDTGAYVGPEERRETGLGGGRWMTVPYVLGMQFYNVSAAGQTVISTQHGMLPGINPQWDVHNPGDYFILDGTLNGTQGTVPSILATGTTVPWPNAMVETNPCVDYIWVRGEYGYVWKVTVESTTTGAQLVAERPFVERTDAEIALVHSIHTYGDRSRARFSYPPNYPNIEHPLGTNPTTTIAWFDDKLVVRADALFTTGTSGGTYLGFDAYRAWSADYRDFQVEVVVETQGTYLHATASYGTSVIPFDDTYKEYTVPGLWGEIDFPSGLHFFINASLPANSIVYAVYIVNPDYLRHAEQPTGAVTEVAVPGTIMSVTPYGEVYQKASSGTVTRPYAYLYSERTLLEDVDDAYDRWTERDNPQPCANRLPIPDPIAGLATNGVLEFTNSAPLEPGYYRLEITSGNIGQPDEAFDGFNVEIQVDATLLQRRLLAGRTGYNVTGTDVFEFEIDSATVGEWLLTITWLNAFADESAGVARRLAIYGYRLYRLSRNLYQVSIAASGTTPDTTALYTGGYTGTTPGGWLMSLNSEGVPVRWQHESTIYPANDTVVSTLPLSALLTGSTHLRVSDVLIRNGTAYDYVLTDAGSTPLPPFTGTIAVT